MKKRNTYRRSAIVATTIVLSVFLLTQCIDQTADKPAAAVVPASPPYQNKVSYNQFAGSASCVSCHKSISKSHTHTAHYLTSRPAEAQYIKGSFEPGKNTFFYNDQKLVAMEKRKDSFYQVEYDSSIEKKARRFDIVVGSGTKGQTFLYWSANRLFELPITYFTAEKQWTNSPGYPNRVIFNRPITSRCLECHSTYFKKTSTPEKEPEEYNHDQIIYGVDCEKCHGPAAKHVEFQTQNPKEKQAKYIINPAKLSRQQNLDLCTLCHGGRLQKSKPSFEFTAGDTLANYFALDTTTRDAANIDVHGNQFGLLKASKCFRMSETMTCTTCHNTHTNEAGKTALFSQRCMSCHTSTHNNVCKLAATMGTAINKNCIDCHMPLQSSKAIIVLMQGASIPTRATMRTHFISIYPDQTAKVMAMLKLPTKAK